MKLYPTFIGIDPGQHGAAAAITGPKVEVITFFGKEDEEVGSWFLERVSGRFGTGENVAKVLIEDVHSSPQMGRASAFSFGYGSGMLGGFLLAMKLLYKLPTERVSPVKWMNALDCRNKKGVDFGKGDKTIQLKRALGMFPKLKVLKEANKGQSKDMADALLIAYYAKHYHYKG